MYGISFSGSCFTGAKTKNSLKKREWVWQITDRRQGLSQLGKSCKVVDKANDKANKKVKGKVEARQR